MGERNTGYNKGFCKTGAKTCHISHSIEPLCKIQAGIHVVPHIFQAPHIIKPNLSMQTDENRWNDLDHHYMAMAHEQARQAMYLSSPNPRVGCIIVNAGGRIIGCGHTQPAGEAHAEIQALNDALQNGEDPAGSIVYVTLEPCSHYGRTPPCTRALIQARVGRVVIATSDPNPLVNGQGIEQLRHAGIPVEVGLLAQSTQELNVGFFKRMRHKKPWVRVKIASTLDGYLALPNGQSQWITGELARQDGQKWRARACALLSSRATVVQDDPKLDVRTVSTPRQPKLVLLDSQLRVPPSARIFDANRSVYIFAAVSPSTQNHPSNHPSGQITYFVAPNSHGKIDLNQMLECLGQLEINELHVEAGGTLTSALLSGKWVDELLIYLAPQLMGGGIPWAQFTTLPTNLADNLQLKWLEHVAIGNDLRLRALVMHPPT
ncbi:MAG: bifunctional diaminohydroxyphosphoribosylaminopyrimidine deaminase/5-amino-6-(5-phosphoribosylamino)uracil reductase RibD [Gammaproteobacteria bacterium]|nr:bifunctional diaminohydroxyphosphoribosylaminopyrimidine deaminase/5-amino-6-(5-phosphoribosylamino)uracil reductase RibD [Gammaproteobacteria bacterium]